MKGQDILVLLKLIARQSKPWRFVDLAQELHMSASEVHAALARCQLAGLYDAQRKQPNRIALEEFLVHGLRYVFPSPPGELARGLPTSFAAPSLKGNIRYGISDLPVMPFPAGSVHGVCIEPLYASAPQAASDDPALYHLLALLDALRVGRARERKLAQDLLRERLRGE